MSLACQVHCTICMMISATFATFEYVEYEGL